MEQNGDNENLTPTHNTHFGFLFYPLVYLTFILLWSHRLNAHLLPECNRWTLKGIFHINFNQNYSNNVNYIGNAWDTSQKRTPDPDMSSVNSLAPFFWFPKRIILLFSLYSHSTETPAQVYILDAR